MLIVATMTVTPVAVVMHGLPPVSISTVAWAGIVGQVVLSTFVATAAWKYGVTRVDSAGAGIFTNIEPLIGALIGVTLFHDPVGLPVVVGGLGIIVGGIIVVRGERIAAPSFSVNATHGLSLN